MLFFRKLFRLPDPVELGRSSYNALPSRQFTPESEDYCWEDWHEEVKEKHPIKYFIAETASDFVRFKIWLPIKRPIEDAHYFVVSHIVPNRRYHMLDLRQPHNKYEVDEYRYGWRDTPELMLYAMFNLLDRFVKNELDQYHCPSEEEVKNEPALKEQRDVYFEILAIHKWWFEDRKAEYKAFEECRTKWHSRRAIRSADAEELWRVMREMEDAYEKKTDDMIARLMKIRRNLWT